MTHIRAKSRLPAFDTVNKYTMGVNSVYVASKAKSSRALGTNEQRVVIGFKRDLAMTKHRLVS